MHLKGTHTLNASPEHIWAILMNPETLARITPGVTRLEMINENQFDAIADVKIGPVKGSFSGKLDVVEKKEPESFTLKVKQDSKIGNVSADVQIELVAADNEQTQLSFNGKARLSGLLARTGQRVLSGVANTLTKQFFKALDEEVSNHNTSI